MYKIYKAAVLPKDHPQLRWGVPEGFPLLVDEDRQKVIAPVLHFLVDQFLAGHGSRWKRRTATAYAFDLHAWFNFLKYVRTGSKVGKDWDLADESDFETFSEQLQDLISNVTHRPLSHSTITRIQGTVEAFYKYAQKRKLYLGDFCENTVKKGRLRPADTDAMIHTRSGEHDTETSQIRDTDAFADVVRPLTEGEWRLLQRELGPLEDDRESDDARPVRDRLAAELSISTGLRVDEVANLTKNQILDLDRTWRLLPEESKDSEYVQMRVTKTKRLKPRVVLVPAYLVPELVRYIDGERQRSIEAGQRYAKSKRRPYVEPRSLFLNHENAGHNAGKQIQASSLSHAMNQACLKAGLTMTVTNTDPDTLEPYDVKLAAHCFHDLRHSFAVWSYHNQIVAGNSEPWKKIQALLGHASLETTRETYLAASSIEAVRASSKVMRHIRALGGENA